jgi:hypothetical protein
LPSKTSAPLEAVPEIRLSANAKIVRPAKIKVPTLVLYAHNDLIFYEPIVEEVIQKSQPREHRSRAGRSMGLRRSARERPKSWHSSPSNALGLTCL